MALFNSTSSFLGIDIGTSSIKLVEIVDRKKRLELTTYAEANLPNLLIGASDADAKNAIDKTANTISQMIEKSGATSDLVVAALPSTIVFSTVLTLPDLADNEMEKAVRFAAQNVVPSDLDEMVLGWSRVASQPHMETDEPKSLAGKIAKEAPIAGINEKKIPVFLTAAPENIVARYIEALNKINLKIRALEVETFPLVRSLFSSPTDSMCIVDLGALATTFHIIDAGTPRVSHTIEYGGHDMTKAIASSLNISEHEAEEQKVGHGLSNEAPGATKNAIEGSLQTIIEKAKTLLRLYQEKANRPIKKAVLIGGGANLKNIATYWAKELGQATTIGNPWRGMSAPNELERKLTEIGPNCGV